MARRGSTFAICAFLAVALLCAPAQSATVFKRSALISDNSTPVTECANRTPCGWGVYQPFTRLVNYFMKNTCKCAANQTCERSEDDVSVSAYIYRCTIPTKSSDHRAGDTNI